MSRNRITAGAATLLLSTMLFAGVAGAQATGSDNSGGNPPGGGGKPTTTTTVRSGPTTTVFEDVRGEEITVETPATEIPVAEPAAVEAENEAPSGTLPFTGGDVAGLVIAGGAALGLGALLVRRSRTADSTN